MTTVGGRIYLSGIIPDFEKDPLMELWSFCPVKGEIDSCAGKMERHTCLNACIRTGTKNQLLVQEKLNLDPFKSLTFDNNEDKRKHHRSASLKDATLLQR